MWLEHGEQESKWQEMGLERETESDHWGPGGQVGSVALIPGAGGIH